MEIIVKVNSTYNNTIVSALYRGKILKTISTGSLGFKKAKRASTLAAQTCGEVLGSWLILLTRNTIDPQDVQRSEIGKASGPTQPRDGVLVGENNVAGTGEGGATYAALLTGMKLLETKNTTLAGRSKTGSGSSKGTRGSVKQSQSRYGDSALRQNKGSQKVSAGLNSVEGGVRKGDSLKGGQSNTTVARSGNLMVSLLIAGVGYGKFGVIRGLAKFGVKIKTISDVTAVPHNGCKPPKMRRK